MDKEEVGRRIKYFREKKNWKQNELANRAGVSPTYIYQLERGLKSVTVEYLGYICNALGISLEEFFRSGSPNEKTAVDALNDKQRDLLNNFLESLS